MQVFLEVVQGDITRLALDAIVNAANESLSGGGGVDGAIHRAAGPGLVDECRAVPWVRPHVRCPTGEAVITRGPVWYGGAKGEPALLGACYRNSLELARQHGLASIAFPCISTGVFGYPLEDAADVALQAVHEITLDPGSLAHIVFCCFNDRSLQTYRERLAPLTAAR
jgi:O-acetyl-ADP-ribose deacetylase (regulator of RNase III)